MTNIKQCKSCASDIKAEASICPVCKKKQGMGLLKKIGLGFLGLVVLGSIFDHQKPPQAPKTPEEIAAEKKASEYRSRIREAQAEAKRVTNNPDSFKPDQAGVTQDGTVCITFRAANGFNAIVPGVGYERGGVLRFDAEGFKRHCQKPMVVLQS